MLLLAFLVLPFEVQGQWVAQAIKSFGSPGVAIAWPSALTGGTGGALYGAASAAVFSVNTNVDSYSILNSFELGADVTSVLEGRDGVLYGTTAVGWWIEDPGTVFKLNADGTGYSIIHSFGVVGAAEEWPNTLVQGRDGALYGTTQSSGSNDVGTVFRLETDGSGYTVLYSFDQTTGAWGPDALIQGGDGALYGSTSGGDTNHQGAVFKVNTDGSGFTVLYLFSSSRGQYGLQPSGGLLQGSDGALEGTTWSGGAFGQGTVFKLNTEGSDYLVLHSFGGWDGAGPGSLVQGSGGVLYGTTTQGEDAGLGAIFKLNTDGSGYAVLHGFAGQEGANPNALVAGSHGELYGTARFGGTNNDSGTVFRLNVNGTGFTVLSTFGTGPWGDWDGARPQSLVQGSDGVLFGATSDGGAKSNGTIFRLDTDGNAYTVLYSFVGYGDGSFPNCVVQGQDGALYGTTWVTNGTVFKLNSDGSEFSLLYSFKGGTNDGWDPLGLIQGSDGALYGATALGGIGDYGALFRLATDGTGYALLHEYTGVGEDGAGPYVPVQGNDGALYGTTGGGGIGGSGTVFKVNTDGSGYTVLHGFTGSNGDGSGPIGLARGNDGTLFGATCFGGANGYGTVFRLAADGTGYAVLCSFRQADLNGGIPGGIIVGSDGAIYGTTYLGGANGGGTVFRVERDGTGFRVIYDFTSQGGVGWYPNVVFRGRDGALYGAAQSGGGTGVGTVFRLSLASAPSLSGISSGPDGSFRLTLSGDPSVLWRLEVATNLGPPVNWMPLTSLVLTNGATQFTDTHATNPPARFYRAVAP